MRSKKIRGIVTLYDVMRLLAEFEPAMLKEEIESFSERYNISETPDFAYRQSGMSLKSQLIQLTNEFGLVFARFGTAEYCEATLMVFRLGTKVDKDPGAPSLPSVQTATLLNACITHVDLGRMSRFSPWSRPYGPAFDYWVPINKQANSYTLWMSLSSKWQLSQQRHAVARDTIPRRKSVTEAAIQLLSQSWGVSPQSQRRFWFGDAVTVVLVVMFVLGDVAAGFTAGSVVGPTPAAQQQDRHHQQFHQPHHLAPRARRSPPSAAWPHRLNHHMRGHGPVGIHHATSTKGPASGHHKSRGHKRPA